MPAPSGSKESSFLSSALTRENPFQSLDEIRSWLQLRQRQSGYAIRRIALDDLALWDFVSETGDLVHRSGKFFSIEGIRVQTSFPWSRARWDQPIINQPEIGILGIMTQVVNGTRYFLLQAKMEPGNINRVQLSPTLQATKSNFSRVHAGRAPKYLEYFTDPRARILVDQLQSEQGTRFLRKRNRNMIIEVATEIPVDDDFRWLSLGEIKELLREDDLVNMDTRTVISCVPMVAETDRSELSKTLRLGPLDQLDGFARDLCISLFDQRSPLFSTDEITSWFTRLKTVYQLSVDYLPLADVREWQHQDGYIRHRSGRFFSVIGVDVEAAEREVSSWSQPILAHSGLGLAGFLVKKINGVLHFLVQAKSEPGVLDIVEMAPSLSIFDLERRAPQESPRPFLDYFLSASDDKIRFSSILSEEGGRLYHLRNRYMIVEADEDEQLEIPENFLWMTLGQISRFVRYDNSFNIEARSLLACLDFSGRVS